MFFKLKYAACCLVLLATGLSWGQDVRVRVNFRGDVTITGTPAADAFDIALTGNKIHLIGFDSTTFDFDGDSHSAIVLPGTSTDSIIRFNLGDGNDYVWLTADAVKSVSGIMGKGEDLFYAYEVIIANDLIIDTGAGVDWCSVDDCIVGRNMQLNLGAGDGTFAERAIFVNSIINGTLRVNQTSGDSECFLTNCTVDSSTRVTLGTGNDDVSLLFASHSSFYVNLGPDTSGNQQSASVIYSDVNGSLTLIGGGGTDDILVGDSSVTGNVVINSAAGDDDVILFKSKLFGNVTVNTSSGDDYVSVGNPDPVFRTTSGNFRVSTGTGDDGLNMDAWETRTFTALLGSGNDTATGRSMGFINIFSDVGDPRINAGAGVDLFNAGNDPDSTNLILSGFEQFGTP